VLVRHGKGGRRREVGNVHRSAAAQIAQRGHARRFRSRSERALDAIQGCGLDNSSSEFDLRVEDGPNCNVCVAVGDGRFGNRSR
jgi:hypothetical protein